MGKILIGLVGLVVGLIVGGLGALSLGGGAMMGVGVGTGLSAGICSTVQAAREQGLLTDEQIDQVLRRAATDLADKATLPASEEMVGGADDCEAVMNRLREAG